MNKPIRITPILLGMMASALLSFILTACSADEPIYGTTDNNPTTSFTITVTDSGFASDGNTGSRVTDNGFTTEFTDGDACGLFIVRGNETVAQNVKLNAVETNGTLSWIPATQPDYSSDDRYFVYFPYRKNLKTTIDTDATTDDLFFANLIEDWKPADDQSDYTGGYTASDLMTGTGIISSDAEGKSSLSFVMTHRMALAVIAIPSTEYSYTNIPDFSTGVVPSFVEFPYEYKPCLIDGKYRYIVNPMRTPGSIVGCYNSGFNQSRKTFTVHALYQKIPSGKYKIYRIDGGADVDTYECKLKAGDLYCVRDDGSAYFIPREAATVQSEHHCIGIVILVGHNDYDISDYSLTGIGQKKCHGYVVALHDVAYQKCKWGPQNSSNNGFYPKNENGYPVNNYTSATCTKDWNGYEYTQQIIKMVGGIQNLRHTIDRYYPATYHAVVEYEEQVPAPSTTSGWFLPSIGQIWQAGRYCSSFFSPAGGETPMCCWSSSERANDSGDGALIFNLGHYDQIEKVVKNKDNANVRPVLAF